MNKKDSNIATTAPDLKAALEFPQTFESSVSAVDKMMMYAAAMRASDVHCDPTPAGISIRLRVDGCMDVAGLIPLRLHEEMIARVKILSGARTDLHAVPQDGRWHTTIGGEEYNLRASFMPTCHGENVVIRLLPVRRSAQVSFSGLGFTSDHIRIIENSLTRTSGLILVTGPTGSGKTTTLRACLSVKAREPISVITLEDPIEYEIPGVRQVHIRHTHGVTFAMGLRAALRQDPDVIMVGEIRDSETAHVAVHTALTGHLVLSTLHTNSALETVPRLIDMGVEPYLLASTLRLIVAQRLVRTVCDDCSGEGCIGCRRSGYSGRSVIVETLPIDANMRELISSRASTAALSAHAAMSGFRYIDEDAAEKIDWGVTTRSEILRVLSL